MNKLKAVVIGVIALIVVIVVLQNTQPVETKLLFITMTLPNAALLFGTLIIGFTIGVLTAGHIVSSAKRPLPNQLPSEEFEEARRGSHGTNR
jgi:lipopolysaccharide assembly protein A